MLTLWTTEWNTELHIITVRKGWLLGGSEKSLWCTEAPIFSEFQNVAKAFCVLN